MAEWFIEQPEVAEEIGPLHPSELLEKVRSGEVRPETRVRKDDSAWFEASAVGGLFEAAMRPTIEYFCPNCRSPIEEPPCLCATCNNKVRQGFTRITENTIQGSQNGSSPTPGHSVQNWLKRKLNRRSDD